ncbi:MAG: hypothetical protein R3B90_08830 [Planctomycetaceae bacterium]
MTRGEFASLWWRSVMVRPLKPWVRLSPGDADQDGRPDELDALLFDPAEHSWFGWQLPANENGLPAAELLESANAIRVKFGGPTVAAVEGWRLDRGELWDADRGCGWRRDLSTQHRQRNLLPEPLRDSFLFTRTHDVWELAVPAGNYRVTVCVGDSGHEQVGQNVAVEGEPLMRNVTTPAGGFLESSCDVQVDDERLTLEIGLPEGATNTCINWVVIEPR